jgi:DNA gyrase inhibitor GyrI
MNDTSSITASVPSDEIEITSAMLAAGVSALCRYDSEFESREEGAERIFRAMLSASAQKKE